MNLFDKVHQKIDADYLPYQSVIKNLETYWAFGFYVDWYNVKELPVINRHFKNASEITSVKVPERTHLLKQVGADNWKLMKPRSPLRINKNFILIFHKSDWIWHVTRYIFDHFVVQTQKGLWKRVMWKEEKMLIRHCFT